MINCISLELTCTGEGLLTLKNKNQLGFVKKIHQELDSTVTLDTFFDNTKYEFALR